MSPQSEAQGEVATSGRIDSWRDFQDRVGAAMAMLAAQPVNVWMADPDFARWPLGQRSVMEALHQWAVASRHQRITVLAADFDDLPRSHPRWAAWRTTWGHRVRCWQAPDELASEVKTTLILDGVLGLKVLEPRLGTGLWTRDVGQIGTWCAEIDVILQRSQEAMPSTTLGL